MRTTQFIESRQLLNHNGGPRTGKKIYKMKVAGQIRSVQPDDNAAVT